MKTPMMLPWLARRAGLSDRQAEALWRAACHRAALLSGEHDSSAYWTAAKDILLNSLEHERWRVHPPLAWPWLLMRDCLVRGSAVAKHYLLPLKAAIAGWQVGANVGRQR